MNVVLVGYRGSGKTAVGRILADRLKLEWIDCDEYIEKTSNLSIREIFEICGESYFREVEGEAIAQISKRNGQVVSTGGGAVLRYKNVHNLKSNGVVIFLDVEPEVACRRIAEDPGTAARRPPLTGKDLLQEVKDQTTFRRPYYEQAADWTVETSNLSPEEVAQKIVALISERFGPMGAP